jgi:hypothetical protein
MIVRDNSDLLSQLDICLGQARDCGCFACTQKTAEHDEANPMRHG